MTLDDLELECSVILKFLALSLQHVSLTFSGEISLFRCHKKNRNSEILLEFRDISRVSEAITAKRMNIYPYCQRQNCSPLNALFSDV